MDTLSEALLNVCKETFYREGSKASYSCKDEWYFESSKEGVSDLRLMDTGVIKDKYHLGTPLKVPVLKLIHQGPEELHEGNRIVGSSQN